MNKYISFILLFTIPALFYTIASFYHLKYHNKPLFQLILISIVFAIVEYTFKVPIIRYGHNQGISNVYIQIIWIILTLIFVYISQKMIFKE